MQEVIKLLNDIFESEVTINDLENEVQKVLLWDSFHIMNFLVEMEEKFDKRIEIEEISDIYQIKDLLQLIQNK